MELLKAAGFGLGAAFIVSIFAGPVIRAVRAYQTRGTTHVTATGEVKTI